MGNEGTSISSPPTPSSPLSLLNEPFQPQGDSGSRNPSLSWLRLVHFTAIQTVALCFIPVKYEINQKYENIGADADIYLGKK